MILKEDALAPAPAAAAAPAPGFAFAAAPARAEPVGARIPLARMPAAEAVASRAGPAAAAPAKERLPWDDAPPRRRELEPKRVEPIELASEESGEFVIEANGGELAIRARHTAPPAAAPAPQRPPSGAFPAVAAPAPAAQRPPSGAFAAAGAAPAAPATEASGAPAFERVVVVDDSALLREITKDALLQYRIARDVRTCANGEEMIQVAAEQFAAGAPVQLAILDLEMPVLNGYLAAIALRAMERGLGAAPTPLLFFSSRAYDETTQRVVEYCKPARFMPKSAEGGPPQMALKLVQVLATIRRA